MEFSHGWTGRGHETQEHRRRFCSYWWGFFISFIYFRRLVTLCVIAPRSLVELIAAWTPYWNYIQDVFSHVLDCQISGTGALVEPSGDDEGFRLPHWQFDILLGADKWKQILRFIYWLKHRQHSCSAVLNQSIDQVIMNNKSALRHRRDHTNDTHGQIYLKSGEASWNPCDDDDLISFWNKEENNFLYGLSASH